MACFDIASARIGSRACAALSGLIFGNCWNLYQTILSSLPAKACWYSPGDGFGTDRLIGGAYISAKKAPTCSPAEIASDGSLPGIRSDSRSFVARTVGGGLGFHVSHILTSRDVAGDKLRE